VKASYKNQSLTREQVLGALEVCGGDGHTLYSADAFPMLPPEWLAPLVTVHKSSKTDPKGMILKDGKVLPYLHAVYSLDLLRKMADTVGVLYRPAFGRGTEARNITEALRAALGPAKEASNG